MISRVFEMRDRTRTREIRGTRRAPLAWRVFRGSRVPSFARFFLAKIWDYSQSRYPIPEHCNQEKRRNRLVSYQFRLFTVSIFVSTVSHWPWKVHGVQVQINYRIHLPIRIQWGERLGVPNHYYHICIMWSCRGVCKKTAIASIKCRPQQLVSIGYAMLIT